MELKLKPAYNCFGDTKDFLRYVVDRKSNVNIGKIFSLLFVCSDFVFFSYFTFLSIKLREKDRNSCMPVLTLI